MAENRWYPTVDQVKDPESLWRTFKQVLDLHYSHADSTAQSIRDIHMGTKASQVPPGRSFNTHISGFPVIPIDPKSLPDGATLKWVSATRSFKFS